MAEPWWKSAVVYQIYPRSFAKAASRSAAAALRGQAGQHPVVGDLEGVSHRLDYLEWLGVDTIWLSPFFRSPMADFGYDVSDFRGVDPLFGTLGDFDQLVAGAHGRGIRVIIDWVPNHTSDQHPWFVESRSSRSSPKRDWYVWRGGDRPPNNWRAAFSEGPAWTFDETTLQWYLHLFLPEQPDLNWANPEVVAAMHDVIRFWLERGVDGFRVDVAHALGKDPDLPDAPAGLELLPWSAQNDHESTHPILRDLRRLVDSYPGERVLVGEVYLLSTAKVAPYYGSGDELHLCFNFPPLFAPWDAGKWRHRVDRVEEELGPRRAWPTWVLSNHDNPRHATRYGSEDRARAATVLLLTLRGTPFLYAGEELGLEDASVDETAMVDPGGRDGCRAPIPWSPEPGHGWPGSPWLPWPPDAERRNVETEAADPGSTLNLYRRLLAARRASPALRLGSWSAIEGPAGTLVYLRETAEDRRAVVVNFTDGELRVPLEGAWTVEVATEPRLEGKPYRGVIGPSDALVAR